MNLICAIQLYSQVFARSMALQNQVFFDSVVTEVDIAALVLDSCQPCLVFDNIDLDPPSVTVDPEH